MITKEAYCNSCENITEFEDNLCLSCGLTPNTEQFITEMYMFNVYNITMIVILN